MQRRGDVKLCLRPTRCVQDVIRVDKNTHLQEEEYFLQHKIILIRSGVTLSFKNLQCFNVSFIFSADMSNPDSPLGKVVFYGKVSGQYGVFGEGTIVKYDLPEALESDNTVTLDNIEDVQTMGDS